MKDFVTKYNNKVKKYNATVNREDAMHTIRRVKSLWDDNGNGLPWSNPNWEIATDDWIKISRDEAIAEGRKNLTPIKWNKRASKF